MDLKNVGKKLYPYQEKDIEILFEKIEQQAHAGYRLLYQLPTGGGKTVVFSEIVTRFIAKYQKKVLLLTHRLELCKQTSKVLSNKGIKNKIIDSGVKKLIRKQDYDCYVAMVETLKNRIKQGKINPEQFGLVIIDEAHHNSFQKLLRKFNLATIIGLTATPLSSDVNLPMHQTYSELVLGEDTASLIEQGYLAKPKTWRYDVELNSLKTGAHGDFTVSTSDELYSSPAMLDLLVHAYEAHSKNKKTLIFNNGIFTSRKVLQVFSERGYAIRHLDNHTSTAERTEILKWFKKTRSAILTSVSILTTGFDEPTVQSIILNRATNSLTLYHQMIGRGSRRLPRKQTFTIIDLGNNADRFGEWQLPLDWQGIFERPEVYYQSLNSHSSAEAHYIPSEMRSKFPNSIEFSFDIQQAYQDALNKGEKPRVVIKAAIKQHALLCADNSENISAALELIKELEKEIDWRVKQYSKCLGKVTKNYTEWLKENYKEKLKLKIQKIIQSRTVLKAAV
jgi:superfamily II DNA or RNA helicase